MIVIERSKIIISFLLIIIVLATGCVGYETPAVLKNDTLQNNMSQANISQINQSEINKMIEEILKHVVSYSDLPNLTEQEANEIYGFTNVNIIGKNMPIWISCSGSMEPIINCEDRYIGIKPRDKFDFKIGDIIHFLTPQDRCTGIGDNRTCYFSDLPYTLHRIIEIRNITSETMYVITAGDFYGYSDIIPVDTRNVLSKIVARLKE